MCGILVIYSKKRKLEKKKCYAATSSISNRGPDKLLSSFLNNKKLFIFNSVLSITGSIKNQKKLYSSKNQRYKLSFNGEIFNYKILQKKYLNDTKSYSNDSDVLINLFQSFKSKIEISKKINGMFSYVVFDNLKNKLIFSSDIQGEKRLYKYNDDDYFILSSTIKSILDFIKKKELNKEVIRNYFCTRHLLFKKNTIYKNISIVEPGQYSEYLIDKDQIKTKIFENPINWINKEKYKKFNSMSEKDLVDFFHNIFLKQLNLMIPKVKFASICSGGIDSSLQTAMINSLKQNFVVGSLHHHKKDKITENLSGFEKKLKKKIHILNASVKKNKRIVSKCTKDIAIPYLTHDFLGRYQISNFFKRKNCKVFFVGDGADELFGGYELYRKIEWTSFKNNNLSPYSSFISKKYVVQKFDDLENRMNNFYSKVSKKYNFLKKKERNLQSSLFTDYFFSALSVYNIGNDLVCCNHAIEPRNVFIQKEILKNIVNLPARYKINRNNHKLFQLKPLLKKIFLKYYSKDLIFKKQGFSGYPNELKPILKDKKFQTIENLNILKKIKIKNNNKLEWKLINLQIFIENFIKKNVFF